MSLRREQAELQRALQLSTQQAQAYARLPPHSLSSAPTDDSREYELRPAQLAVAGTPSTPMPPRSIAATPDGDLGTFPAPMLGNALAGSSRPTVEVVVPLPNVRTPRGGSPDPLDCLRSPSVEFDQAGPLVSSVPPMPSASSERGPAADDTTGTRRLSARQQVQKEKEAAAKEERKRKRVEEKERKARAEAERQRAIDAGEHVPSPAEKRKKPRTDSKATTSTKDATKTPKSRDRVVVDLTTPPPSSSSSAPVTSPTKTTKAKSPFFPPSPEKRAPEREPTPPSHMSPAHRSPAAMGPEPRTESPKSPIRSTGSTHAAVCTPVSGGPLQPARSTPRTSTPSGRPWKTARDDLSSVLAKFPRAKSTGMSRKLKIVPLHAKIGPGVKALPPPPPRSGRKVEEEEDEDEEVEGKVKVGSREWLMMED